MMEYLKIGLCILLFGCWLFILWDEGRRIKAKKKIELEKMRVELERREDLRRKKYLHDLASLPIVEWCRTKDVNDDNY